MRLLLVFCLLPLAGWADNNRPLFVKIAETAPEQYDVEWKMPPVVSSSLMPDLLFPEHCEPHGGVAAAARGDGFWRQASYRCVGGLGGHQVEIRYPVANPALATVLRLATADGREQTQLLSPDEDIIEVPVEPLPNQVAKDYTVLGIEHILIGVDHLLFVACLLWIARTWRRVLVTITGFTLAHSATLGLSALGWVRIPVAPVEAVIALSIVFLAVEIARDRRDTLTWRYPVAVSASFGLLHGFGFAAALAEIGLPEQWLVTGLLFFNVGVEIGQLMFAAAILGGLALVRRFTVALRGSSSRVVGAGSGRLARVGERGAVYTIGAVACFWLIERTTALFMPMG